MGRFLSSLLFLVSMARASDENCTVCPGGDQMAFPEKLLNLTWPVIADSCSSLDQYTRSLGIDSDECTRIQSISSICGCPISEDACKLCPDGSNITEHNKNLSFLEADFDGITPTCELLDAYLHSFNSESSNCTEIQRAGTLCGCPIPRNGCTFCHTNVTLPGRLVPQFEDFKDSDSWELYPPTCDLVEAVAVGVEKEGSLACTLAQYASFLCGCQVEESLRRRQVVLAWLPRITAPLSFFGSMFIIYDVLRSKKKSQMTQNHLLLVMSIVDCMSSVAWVLTTLPIPTTDEYGDPTNAYGARGNEATCKAQGFFIQLGLTSPFCNLSLAVYYLLVISYGYTGTQIKKFEFYMVGIPVLFGLALAFAGIPFYTDDGAMCYLDEFISFFLVLPLAIVIVFATLIMLKVYQKVYNQERVARRWTVGSSNIQSLPKKVFWQAFFYLLSFYATWPILMAVPLVDANFYRAYGFVCVAMLLAPLQGFFNFITYTRPRFHRYMERKRWCSCFTAEHCCRKRKRRRESEPLENRDAVESAIAIAPAASVINQTKGEVGTSDVVGEPLQVQKPGGDQLSPPIIPREDEDAAVEEACGSFEDHSCSMAT